MSETTNTDPTMGDQQWVLQQAPGWKVTPVPCADVFRAAGHELDRGCWRRDGRPAPGIGSTDHEEIERLRTVARELGLMR